jgi:hypothetical protein
MALRRPARRRGCTSRSSGSERSGPPQQRRRAKPARWCRSPLPAPPSTRVARGTEPPRRPRDCRISRARASTSPRDEQRERWARLLLFDEGSGPGPARRGQRRLRLGRSAPARRGAERRAAALSHRGTRSRTDRTLRGDRCQAIAAARERPRGTRTGVSSRMCKATLERRQDDVSWAVFGPHCCDRRRSTGLRRTSSYRELGPSPDSKSPADGPRNDGVGGSSPPVGSSPKPRICGTFAALGPTSNIASWPGIGSPYDYSPVRARRGASLLPPRSPSPASRRSVTSTASVVAPGRLLGAWSTIDRPPAAARRAPARTLPPAQQGRHDPSPR